MKSARHAPVPRPLCPRRAASPERRTTGAFTLVELLVVIAIITLLAGMLLPVLANAVEEARKASCRSNEKQIHVLLGLYADDHEGWMPQSVGDSTSNWITWNLLLIREKYGPENLFFCPSDRMKHARGSYAMNAWMKDEPAGVADSYLRSNHFNLQRIRRPSRLYLGGDIDPGGYDWKCGVNVAYRHRGRVCYLYADGRTAETPSLDSLTWRTLPWVNRTN